MEVERQYAGARTKAGGGSSVALWKQLSPSDLSSPSRAAGRPHSNQAEASLAARMKKVPVPNVAGFAFFRYELEMLARVEHKRWMAHRYLHGWNFTRK